MKPTLRAGPTLYSFLLLLQVAFPKELIYWLLVDYLGEEEKAELELNNTTIAEWLTAANVYHCRIENIELEEDE